MPSPTLHAQSDWPPACGLVALRARARVLAAVRRFFAERDVLEVETPLLCRTGAADPYLESFAVPCRPRGELYLQTSPEFAMKRLLAAGSGSIYQICKAFRDGEAGRWHNPEFTLLEWYRVGFSLHDLMDEVEALLAAVWPAVLDEGPAERRAYADLFRAEIGLDPLTATPAEFAGRAAEVGLPEAVTLCGEDRGLWLDLLFSHRIQPGLGRGRPVFVHDYPALLPSLAQRKPGQPEVVERVEVFLQGVELGNGFHELADADEQAERFERDFAARRVLGRPVPPRDESLLAALRAGLPDCSGIAIGLDRLLMLMTGAAAIAEVLAFPMDRA